MAETPEEEMGRLAETARFSGTETVPEIVRKVRDEVASMLLRVATRESDKTVATRLREIAGQLREATL